MASSSQGSSSSDVTTNHEEIRKWVEARRGHPACVRGPGDMDDVGLLRDSYKH
jgi:hypothetical protein